MKFITLIMGMCLCIIQYFYLPFSRVIEIRTQLGIIGWLSLSPLLVGLFLMVVSGELKKERKNE